MYSIVLMTALTATPDTPQFNGYFRDLFNRNGCNGCNGCSGAARYSCSGCSGSMAYTASCSGCSGCCGSCNGHVFGLGLGDRMRSWFNRDTSAYGCCGSHSYGCCGGTSLSCTGAAYSCFGGPTYSYTPVLTGGLSCQGGMPLTAPPPMFDTFPTPGVPTTPGVPGIPYAVPDPAPGMTGLRPTGGTSATLTANGPTARATVLVKLPADAKLYADSRALTLTGAERKFVSPELPVNQEFVYRFRAEYERDGEIVSVTKKVKVQAGATATVEFVDLTAAKPSTNPPAIATATGSNKGEKPAVPAVKPSTAEPPIKTVSSPASPAALESPVAPVAPASTSASERATITVKLPPGATLYVDDRRSPSQEPVRSFATPPLPAGREFAYLLKAEVIRNGQPESLTQKVPFRAGERVIVDFTSLGK